MDMLLFSLILALLVILIWHSITRGNQPPLFVVQRRGTTYELRRDHVEALERARAGNVNRPPERKMCGHVGSPETALRLTVSALLAFATLVTIARTLSVV